MCGIAGILNLKHGENVKASHLRVMNDLIRHRGPDGEGVWVHPQGHVGFGHCRLSIIDLTEAAGQPMTDESGNWVAYNGEIYNYLELREELGIENFRTKSDTEVILHAYRKWGRDCVHHFHGMFAFALWDEAGRELFCARDRFGIKPFYFMTVRDRFYFASEIKALIPFVDEIATDPDGLKDYLSFQFCLHGKTLFRGIGELPPGRTLSIVNGNVSGRRYWEVYYDPDFNHTERYFEERLRSVLEESVRLHMRSDVPVGAYVSGGLDSSTTASLARMQQGRENLIGFTGRFDLGPEYDESGYAGAFAEWADIELHEIRITAADFMANIERVIYHLDYPVAGPGAFPQYMVSQLAARFRKCAVGGQGGDEIFGGYARYLASYFEQCIKAAIDGTMDRGNFIVTYQSIIPNLTALRGYKPMLKEFWREGLFDEMDKRYFRLINRSPRLTDEINWSLLGDYSPYETFRSIFYGRNVGKESYFDLMTHFDFKTLLPALLQVEDRVSMAHGIESRVPLLYHPLVELAATIPADIKFRNGEMKHIFRKAVKPFLPEVIFNRRDKMGFPTPLTEWAKNGAREFITDIFTSERARHRPLFNNARILDGLNREPKYGRKLWGLLCLELWQRAFHDRECEFKKRLTEGENDHEDTDYGRRGVYRIASGGPAAGPRR